MQRIGQTLLAVSILVGLNGCSGNSADGVQPVHGSILYNGKPVTNAQVTFHPVNASAKEGVRPVGKVDEQGQFTLTTFKKGDGAPAGEYRVTIVWYLATPTRPGTDDTVPMNHLPVKYANAETSNLTASVNVGSNELQPFLLK